jgi:protease II
MNNVKNKKQKLFAETEAKIKEQRFSIAKQDQSWQWDDFL